MGQLGDAAKFIENTLANFVPLLLDFLARLLRLGNVSEKIKKILMRVRKPIDDLIAKVMAWIKKKIRGFKKKKKGDKGKDKKGKDSQSKKYLDYVDSITQELNKKPSATTPENIYSEKKSAANKLEVQYSKLLKKPHKVSISFVSLEQAKKEGSIKAKIKIIGGNVSKSIAIALKPEAEKIKWWEHTAEFKDKSKEEHTIFIKGKGANAKLMMHSVEKQIIKHIEVYQKDASTRTAANRAMQLYKEFVNTKTIIVKGGSTPAETKTASQRILAVINEMSEIFRNLPGSFTNAEYPVWSHNTDFISNGNKPTKVQAKYLTDVVQYGSAPGDGTGVTGWATVRDLRLTGANAVVGDPWIQFHLLNDNLGGRGEPNNLVPTPNSINRAYAKFESETYKLAFNTTRRGQNQNRPGQKNVVWMDVKVVYRKGKYQGKDMSPFVARVEASSGIYIYKPKDGNNSVRQRWVKDPKKVYSVHLQVPNPYLMAQGVNLNQNGQQQMEDFFNSKGVNIDRKVLDIIVNNRLYSNKTDLLQKITPLLIGKQLDSVMLQSSRNHLKVEKGYIPHSNS